MHPARETSSPRAGDKKRVWNVRADGNRQRYPTPGVKIARRHRVTSLMESCLSRQGQLVCDDRGTRRRRRCKSALHRGRETGP